MLLRSTLVLIGVALAVCHSQALKYYQHFNLSLNYNVLTIRKRNDSLCCMRPFTYGPFLFCCRYLLSGFPQERFAGNDSFLVHWDDDEETLRTVLLGVWIVDVNDEGNISVLDRVDAVSVGASRPQQSR